MMETIKLSKTYSVFSSIISLSFAGLVFFGTFMKETTSSTNTKIHLCIAVAFLLLAIYSLNIWQIYRREDTLIFKKLLGIKKYEINLYHDRIEIDSEVYTTFESLRIYKTLIMKTDQKNFRFYERSYKQFDQMLSKMFQGNTTYINDYKRSLRSETKRSLHLDQLIYYPIAVILYLIIILFL